MKSLSGRNITLIQVRKNPLLRYNFDRFVVSTIFEKIVFSKFSSNLLTVHQLRFRPFLYTYFENRIKMMLIQRTMVFDGIIRVVEKVCLRRLADSVLILSFSNEDINSIALFIRS
jgi:hypothetical protein